MFECSYFRGSNIRNIIFIFLAQIISFFSRIFEVRKFEPTKIRTYYLIKVIQRGAHVFVYRAEGAEKADHAAHYNQENHEQDQLFFVAEQ